MPRYAVHDTGEWVRNSADSQATRTEATVREFESLGDLAMHPLDKQQFDWMLERGVLCITMGSTVYQIRRDT